MSTFGPVIVPTANDIYNHAGPLRSGMPLQAVTDDHSGFFWDVDGQADYKPVVHCKCGHSGFSGREYLGNNIRFAFCGDTIYNGYTHVWRSSPGRLFDTGSYWGSAHKTISWSQCNGYFEIAVFDHRWEQGVCVVQGGWLQIVVGRRHEADDTWSPTFERIDWTSFSGSPTLRDGVIAHITPVARECVLANVRYYWNSWAGVHSVEVVKDGFHRVQEAIANQLYNAVRVSPEGRRGTCPYTRVNAYTLLPQPSLGQLLLFGEDRIVDWGNPFRAGQLSQYWLDLGRSKAFADACANMPTLSDNSISNIQEVLSFLLAIVRREPQQIPSSLADAWLAYRYQYSTTKMDVKEAWKFINRVYDLNSIHLTGRAHGTVSFPYHGTTVTCRVSFDVAPRHLRGLADLRGLWRELSTLGLAPDLYYLWDSTPFSFVVDWFLPVGDVLGAIDASMLYTNESYEFNNIVYSLSYSHVVNDRSWSCYSRWLEMRSPEIQPIYWLEPSGPPTKRQLLYRTLDAVSLTLGRR